MNSYAVRRPAPYLCLVPEAPQRDRREPVRYGRLGPGVQVPVPSPLQLAATPARCQRGRLVIFVTPLYGFGHKQISFFYFTPAVAVTLGEVTWATAQGTKLNFGIQGAICAAAIVLILILRIW